MVVGTAQGWGEDYPCQGRLLVLRVEAGGRGGQATVLSTRCARAGCAGWSRGGQGPGLTAWGLEVLPRCALLGCARMLCRPVTSAMLSVGDRAARPWCIV